jgi:hypothetical protein
MLGRLKEIMTTPILREWLTYRVLHPWDGGVKTSSLLQRPSYLDKINFQVGKPVKKLAFTSHFEKVDYQTAVKKLSLNEDFLVKPNIIAAKVVDSEEHGTYYRFQWLSQYMVLGGSVREALAVINEWCKTPIPFFDNAYTTAERIGNWVLFLERTNALDLLSDSEKELINKRVEEDAYSIIDNFEFYGDDLTGNHLLANARGLAWAGYFLGSLELLEYAKKIVEEEISRLSPVDGMIREGSSHYQFLLTRNLLESLMIFKCSSLERLGKLEVAVREHAKSCLFFKVNDKMPYFGDISPDAPPFYFWHVPEAALFFLDQTDLDETDEVSKGWASNYFVKLKVKEASDVNAFESKRGEFVRLEKDGAILFFHLNSNGIPLLATHAHCDSGAAVLYYCGREVLIDTGRLDYGSSSKSYTSSSAHNVLLIDGKAPEEMRRGVFGQSFIKWRFSKGPGLECISDDDVKVHLSSFDHLGIKVIRRYTIINNSVVLEFSLLGKGKHHLFIPFFLHKSVDTQALSCPEEGEWLLDDSRLLTARAIAYGVEDKLKAASWSGHVKLPWIGHFTIDLGKI